MFGILVCLRRIKNYGRGWEQIKLHNVPGKLINFYISNPISPYYLRCYKLDNVSSLLDTSVFQITNSIPNMLHFL